jgi:hypothetical protein
LHDDRKALPALLEKIQVGAFEVLNVKINGLGMVVLANTDRR